MRRMTANLGKGVALCWTTIFPVAADNSTLPDALRPDSALVDDQRHEERSKDGSNAGASSNARLRADGETTVFGLQGVLQSVDLTCDHDADRCPLA